MSKAELMTSNISDYVLDMLAAQGLGISRQVEISQPSLPEDITAIDERELMNLYTNFAAYTDFINTQLSCAIIDEKETERLIDVMTAGKTVTMSTGKASDKVTIIKAQISADPDMINLENQLLARYAYRKMMETISTNCERSTAVCSRELTRRTAGDNYRSRTSKFNA
jgi:hypothetical protein